MINDVKNDSIIYRQAELPSESEKIIELMDVCFDRKFRTDWFEWFNCKCPFGKNEIFVAEDSTKSKLIGAYGLLPVNYAINKKNVNGLLCTNVLTHPDYRGKGIFTNIGKYSLSSKFDNHDVKFSLGVPNDNAIKGHLKIGWNVISELTFYKKTNNRKIDVNCSQIFEFMGEHGTLATSVAMNRNFAMLKDSNFLNWRYFERPDKEYLVYEMRNEGVLQGFIVLKYFDQNDYKKLHIMDIYAINDFYYTKLIEISINIASECDELNCWQINNSKCIKLLLKLGFIQSDEKNTLIMFENGVETLIEDDWCFMLGDNDVY